MVIIVCVIFIAILLIISLSTDVRGNGSCCAGIFVGLSIAFLLFIIIDEKDLSVKPIDVYRGKTTLEITYRDSVAVDSTVVWKEEQS